ncbi:hypothetical protein AB0E82_01940 [Streptomyces anulatus]|uniref:hypothetical protein n=1 Tax=Streptomyces anulatus TaxID=1892 RepID=UPI0033C8DD07
MKPTPARRRGHCPTCARPYHLRTDGTLPAHPTRTGQHGYCAGSRKPPTTQPRIPLDDLTSDALDALYDQLDNALQAVEYFDAQSKRRGERIRELEAKVARLTAGQCTDQRAMCEQHHLPPVAGCPYPRCRAARATGRAATA